MSTSVEVKANHGWPVDVTRQDPKTGLPLAIPDRVQAGDHQTFYVHEGQDLIIHEVQPGEVQKGVTPEAEPTKEEPQDEPPAAA